MNRRTLLQALMAIPMGLMGVFASTTKRANGDALVPVQTWGRFKIERGEGVCVVMNLQHVPQGWFTPTIAEVGVGDHVHVVYRGAERLFVIVAANGSVTEMSADTTRIRLKPSTFIA